MKLLIIKQLSATLFYPILSHSRQAVVVHAATPCACSFSAPFAPKAGGRRRRGGSSPQPPAAAAGYRQPPRGLSRRRCRLGSVSRPRANQPQPELQRHCRQTGVTTPVKQVPLPQSSQRQSRSLLRHRSQSKFQSWCQPPAQSRHRNQTSRAGNESSGKRGERKTSRAGNLSCRGQVAGRGKQKTAGHLSDRLCSFCGGDEIRTRGTLTSTAV